MNSPGDIPISNGVSEHPCGLTSLIPTIGMSCRGRAEAFARRLQSKLRTLGSQSDESPTNEDNPIMNGLNNTWLNNEQTNQLVVTAIQPLRHNELNVEKNEISDSYFDFDCEIESPGSPVDECEYSRLIETTSNTPHDCATTAESGYQCSSPITSRASSQSSDGPYFDPENSDSGCNDKHLDVEPSASIIATSPNDYYDCSDLANKLTAEANFKREHKTHGLTNGSDKFSEYSKNGDCNGEFKYMNGQEHDISTDCVDFSGNELKTHLTSSHTEEPLRIDNNQDVSTTEQKENNTNELINDALSHNANLLECHKNNKSSESSSPTSITENGTDICNDKENQSPNENSSSKLQKLSTLCDTDDDDDCRPQRVRRCSSLKTGKTPPGTPGRKKIVRFADVLGLDLADVKTFLDEIPNIPSSAYQDLEIIESVEQQPLQLGPKADRILMPMFQQPGGLPAFLDAVRDKQVNLENAMVTDNINLTIGGSVRVRNLDFHKSVHIRVTYDNWRTFYDLPANYVQNSCDGFSDKFEFTIYNNKLPVGQRLELAIRFQCKGQQFWDNNYGSNYCFQCLPVTNAITSRLGIIPTHHTNNSAMVVPASGSDVWCPSFY